MTDMQHHKGKTTFYTAYAAIVIVSILIAIKAYAYYSIGSVSVLSSLIDSVMDSIVSVLALCSLYYARRPADEDHRWGHGKMEAVSALFQSAVITGGGAFLVFESVNRLFAPTHVTHHKIGIIVMVVSILLSAVLVGIQRRTLRRTESLAIEADSVHYGSDILVNLGVLGILVLGHYGAPLWIDPVFAVMVALFMAHTARGIAVKSLDMLLDRELPENDRTKIVSVIEAHEGVIGWHDLRTHRNGVHNVMSFDIEVAANLSLWAAHDIAKDLETEILEIYPDSDILIHVDPQGYIEDARHRVKGVHH